MQWTKEVENFTKRHDRVRLLEDTDGDGRADRDEQAEQNDRIGHEGGPRRDRDRP